MEKLYARARIIQDFEIALDKGRSHSTVADQPTETSPDLGPTPLELCVMSHAGCYVTICALTASRMRLPFKSCDIEIEAVESEETGTITEETLNMTLKVDASADRVQRLHKLTLKHCPVGILFERAGVKTNYNLKNS